MNWLEVMYGLDEPDTCEAFNVRRQGMCKAQLDRMGDCPDQLEHGDPDVINLREWRTL